jgi:hypothetical protein
MTEFQLQTNATPDSSSDSEVRSDVRKAFSVLVDAVATLTREGDRPPTASEARLAMKRLTYGGFSPKDLGYSRFRDFLADAETRGLIVVDASRQGDVAVHLGSVMASVGSRNRVIRRDLWRAFIDWTSSLARFYDLKYQRAVVVPAEPAPLEPAKYREFRARLESNPEDFVRIEPILVQTQISWMKDFAGGSADPQIRAVLLAALNSEKPVKAFNGVLRTVPGQAIRWKNAFQTHAREHIESWRRAAGSGRQIEIYRDSEEQATETTQSAKSELHESTTPHKSVPVPTSFTFQVGATPFTNFAWPIPVPSHTPDAPASTLRARLHAAIDRMPIDELKALRIPVGYLFED